MPQSISFKEPERCEFLYIDENNKVHLLLPIVGGDEIGLDNTCQTLVELKSFFFGSTSHNETRYSAEYQLAEYKKQLELDIQAITSQIGISRESFKDLLREKKERLKQIEKYIELIQVLKSDYDKDEEIENISRNLIAPLPAGMAQIIRASSNAMAMILSPRAPDLATSFRYPGFRVMRDYENKNSALKEGLGYRLRSTFFPEDQTPTPLNKKSIKDKIIEDVLAQSKFSSLKGDDHKEKLEILKNLIQQQYAKIHPALSVKTSRDTQKLDWDYLVLIMGVGDDSTIVEWINAIIDSTVDPEFLDMKESEETASVFYDGQKLIKDPYTADKMSIKVQYLLAEINFYCKTNKLSDANFGEFFDKEPYATQIAQLVKAGLAQGAHIESILYQYVNDNHVHLGLAFTLTIEQQKEIIAKFTQHYNTIKDSPHFDEFFVADPDKKGNIFSHQGRISCHFLDFFVRHSHGEYPLGELEGYSDDLQNGNSNRLNHKNDVVAQGYERIERFKQEIIRLLKENKAKELLAYLVATSSSGIPNYSMLSLETQNYISYNRNWPAIERELFASENISVTVQQDLLRLLSRDNVDHENLSAIAWSKHSAKPLLEVELNKIAEGLSLTVEIYNQKRDKQQWYKGSRNEAREGQCRKLKQVAEEINLFLDNESLSKAQVLEKLLKSIETLDRIDNEISTETKLFKSTLQKEIGIFRNKLKDMCELDKFAFKSTKYNEIISLETQEQFNKIKDPEVLEIFRDLPPHCHNSEAAEFFNGLNVKEATKVSNYLSLEYREINSTTDKKTLLEQDIPALFKEVNMQLLCKLKEENIIDEEAFDKLSQVAHKTSPEKFTRKSIEKESVHFQQNDRLTFRGQIEKTNRDSGQMRFFSSKNSDEEHQVPLNKTSDRKY